MLHRGLRFTRANALGVRAAPTPSAKFGAQGLTGGGNGGLAAGRASARPAGGQTSGS